MAASSSWCEILPEDLVFQILIWLPVASLLRFKSVSKSWLSLIDSPRFISQHTRRISSNDNQLIIMHDTFEIWERFNSDFPDLYAWSFSFVSADDLRLSKHVMLPPIDDHHSSSEVIVSSFNGIICLRYLKNVEFEPVPAICLWNPATKELTILPPPPDIEEDELSDISYGFGFDVRTDDHKVVRISFQNVSHGYTSFESWVQVYSLSMGCWRVIDAVVPVYLSLDYHFTKPFLNEIYCWAGYHPNTACYSIVSFNFSNEAFQITQLPELDISGNRRCPVLTFLREKIACIDWDSDNSNQSCHCNVWVLDEYGAKETWTKLYSIPKDVVGGGYVPVEFSVAGKLIFREVEDRRKVCLYDPLTQEKIYVLIPWKFFDVTLYKESLISVTSANCAKKRLAYEFPPIYDYDGPVNTPDTSELWLDYLTD